MESEGRIVTCDRDGDEEVRPDAVIGLAVMDPVPISITESSARRKQFKMSIAMHDAPCDCDDRFPRLGI